MSKLNFIKPIADFQYSINLEFDYANDNKIKAYLPTANALALINEIIKSTENNHTDKARLLTGSYGKGKSHLTLTILSLLAKRDKKLFNNILNKAKEIDLDIYNNINQFIKSKKKFFPVIITSNDVDLSSILLVSLKNALERDDLIKLMPTTFYDKAIESVLNWKNNFEKTYTNFEKLVNCDGDKFINYLKLFDKDKYNKFIEVFPELTSGTNFNPSLDSDVLKIYDIVNEKLIKLGYAGIFIVYDEFGKFLESCAAADSAMNIKLLQDLAEKSTRINDSQIHLFMISHKGIENYIGGLTKKSVNSWKAVAERFKAISIESKDNEIYQMTAQVLKKDQVKFDVFKNANFDEFKKLNSYISNDTKIEEIGVFDSIKNELGVTIVNDCYPLHPYTMLMLPKISELVAQNERTIFTYLASNEKFTVNYFVKHNAEKFPLIEPDQIYDYFEPLFKGEPHGSPIRKQWEITQRAVFTLTLKEDVLAIKMVKTLALIYIINQFEIMPPTLVFLANIYDVNYDSVEVAKAVSVLKSSQLLIELEYKPHVRVRQSSGNNIDELLDDEIAKGESSFNAKNVLVDSLISKYIYPMEYNDMYEVTRFFEFDFIEFSDLTAIINIDVLLSHYKSDGVVLGILVDDEIEHANALEYVKRIGNDRVVFIIPNVVSNISLQMKKYQAVQKLIQDKKEDEILVDELRYIANDLADLINHYIDSSYLKPELKNSQYFYNTQIKTILRRRDITKLLSNICRVLFNNTPKIINENINRNCLSSPIAKSRERIIASLLENKLKPNLGLVGSQDINLARSLLVVPNIIEDLENPVINLEQADENIRGLINYIEDFTLRSVDRNRNISEIYEILKEPQYHIGLKDGLIPIFLALGLRRHKEHLVFKYKKKEKPLTTNLLLALNNDFAGYTIRLEGWNNEKENYVQRLEAIFAYNVKPSEKELSSFDYITKAMQRWYMELPKFVKETKFVRSNGSDLQDLLETEKKMKILLSQPEINSREFLFEKLPTIYGTQQYDYIIRYVERFKARADSCIGDHLQYIKNLLIKLLNVSEKATLASAVKDFYDSINEKTRMHVFDNEVSSFMDMFQMSANDEMRFVNKLIKNLYSLNIGDFNDSYMSSVESKLINIINKILDYDKNINDEIGVSSFKVDFIDDVGKTITKHFKSIEISDQAETLKDEIGNIIGEYGMSIDNTEKGQILLELLKELTK